MWIRIKKDDIEIEKEGIDSLSESELRAACRERGMLGIQSIGQMQIQVKEINNIIYLYKYTQTSIYHKPCFYFYNLKNSIIFSLINKVHTKSNSHLH